ncbi:hypothetical protein [Phaffia rhodozyma]|uniref:Uncharacterized protein n=1 Tax=Phaffia rhodozyma TaxID=264483 RepID=A0A0F7SK40_PHARH|nr:hypothetical protein [Phaffia rhodozyma]
MCANLRATLYPKMVQPVSFSVIRSSQDGQELPVGTQHVPNNAPRGSGSIMAPSIATPLLLASYSPPVVKSSKTSSSKQPVKVSSVQPVGAGASSNKQKGKKSTSGPIHQLAVAVNGEGVWRYDIAALNPVWSHTVPPTTTFATAPVSIYNPAGDITTLVALDQHEDLDSELARRTVWCWRGEQDKETLELPSPVSRLIPIPSSPDHILAVHSTSASSASSDSYSIISLSSTIAVSALNVTSASSTKSRSSPTFAFLRPRWSCAFASSTTSSVSTSQGAGDVFVEVFPEGLVRLSIIAPSGLSGEGVQPINFKTEKEFTITGLKKEELVTEAVLLQTGVMQVLTSHSHLHTLALSMNSLKPTLVPHTFPSTPAPSSPSHPRNTTILRLPGRSTSAYTLLFSTQSMQVHLVNPIYPAVISSFPLPQSMVAPGSAPIGLEAFAYEFAPNGAGERVIFVARRGSDNGGKISVWVSDVNGGEVAGRASAGGLSDVLFAAQRTAKVLVPVSTAQTGSFSSTAGSIKSRRVSSSAGAAGSFSSSLSGNQPAEPFHELLPRLRSILLTHQQHGTWESPAEIANAVEKVWVEAKSAEESRLAQSHERVRQEYELQKAALPEEVQRNPEELAKRLTVQLRPCPAVILPAPVAKGLLQLVFVECKSMPKEAYPSKLITQLIQRLMVSEHMLPGGFSQALLARGDWSNIMLLIRDQSAELSPAKLIGLLNVIIDGQAQPTELASGRLPSVSRLVLDIGRFGVRPNESAWKDAVLGLGMNRVPRCLEAIEDILSVIADPSAGRTDLGGLPQVANIVPFTTLLLDTYLLTLLSLPSAPTTLSRIQAYLQAHTLIQRELELAQANFDGALRLIRSAETERRKLAAAEGEKNTLSRRGGRGRKEAIKKFGEMEGPYRLETFDL